MLIIDITGDVDYRYLIYIMSKNIVFYADGNMHKFNKNSLEHQE